MICFHVTRFCNFFALFSSFSPKENRVFLWFILISQSVNIFEFVSFALYFKNSLRHKDVMLSCTILNRNFKIICNYIFGKKMFISHAGLEQPNRWLLSEIWNMGAEGANAWWIVAVTIRRRDRVAFLLRHRLHPLPFAQLTSDCMDIALILFCVSMSNIRHWVILNRL